MTKNQNRFLGCGLLAAALVATVICHTFSFYVIGHIHITAFYVKLPEFVGFHVKLWEFALEAFAMAVAVALLSLSQRGPIDKDLN
jgi:hypothetical protein